MPAYTSVWPCNLTQARPWIPCHNFSVIKFFWKYSVHICFQSMIKGSFQSIRVRFHHHGYILKQLNLSSCAKYSLTMSEKELFIIYCNFGFFSVFQTWSSRWIYAHLDSHLRKKFSNFAMKKHRFRDSMKSLFGSHIDAEKDEQRKGTKIGKYSL